ncbi:MAG: hypothetical protein SNJ59_04600 [Aggregatilineales bacterium]
MRMLITILIVLALTAPLAARGQGGAGRAGQPGQASLPPLTLAPDLFVRASRALDERDWDRALLDFSLFLLLNPTYSQGYFGRGLTYLGLEQEEAALADFEAALATAPLDAGAYRASIHRLRGDIHSNARRFEAALADYDAVIELAPNAEAFANRALMHLALADHESARADLTRAIELEAGLAPLYLYRAYVNIELERWADAADDYFAYITTNEARRIRAERPLISEQLQFIELQRGTVHEFRFEGRRGQIATFVAQRRPSDSVDPLLVLLGPDGRAIAADDDSAGDMNAAVRLTLPFDGAYTLLVSHSLGGSTGAVAVGVLVE